MIYTVLALHFVADFVCQTRWMAENKVKNIWALSAHVGVYSLVFWAILSVLYIPFGVVASSYLIYILVNGVLHFITDFYSSKLTKYYSGRSDWHNFFVVIGADQLIHQVCLISTIFLLV